MTAQQHILQLKITELAADIELEVKFEEHSWATRKTMERWLTLIDDIGDVYADELR